MAFDTDDPSSFDGEPSLNQTGIDTPGFLGGHSDFVLFGVYNGIFAKGPPDPTLNIDVTSSTVGSNFMPHWRFVQSSNTNITAKQVRDVASPSGSNLRFTFVAGAAADEAFIEQITDIGGNRFRTMGTAVRLTMRRVTASNNGFQGSVAAQYLTIDGDATGNAVTSVMAWTSDGQVNNATAYAHTTSGGSPPANAHLLRIRIVVKRNTAANGATGTFDVTDVRVDRAVPNILVAESGDVTRSAGLIKQSAGTLSIGPDGQSGPTIQMDPSSGDISLNTSAGTVQVSTAATFSAVGAPAGPLPSHVALFSDTSMVIRALDTSGRSYFGVDGLLFPATQVSAPDVNTLDDYEEGTWTPAAAYGTAGTSSWAVTTQVGWYTKIGNRVLFNFFYQGVPTNGTASGNLTITGVPFASINNSNDQHMFATSFQGYTKAGFTQITGKITAGSSIFLFDSGGSAQTLANLVVADIPSGGTVIIKCSGSYQTAT